MAQKTMPFTILPWYLWGWRVEQHLHRSAAASWCCRHCKPLGALRNTVPFSAGARRLAQRGREEGFSGDGGSPRKSQDFCFIPPSPSRTPSRRSCASRNNGVIDRRVIPHMLGMDKRPDRFGQLAEGCKSRTKVRNRCHGRCLAPMLGAERGGREHDPYTVGHSVTAISPPDSVSMVRAIGSSNTVGRNMAKPTR